MGYYDDKKADIWQPLAEKDEVAFCTECGTKIWIFWKLSKDARAKKEVMTKCAPCYFGRTKDTGEV